MKKYFYTYLIDGGEYNYLQSVNADDDHEALESINKMIGVYGDEVIRLHNSNYRKVNF